MGTTTRWIVPCYFSHDKQRTDPIVFDLTSHLNTILSNEVWNRKFSYGFDTGLKNTDPADIESAVITIYPRFFSGYVNENRLPEIIEKICGVVPEYLKVNSYKDWSHRNGFVVIETKYKSVFKSIPTKKDLTGHFIPHFEEDFFEITERQIAVAKELASFLLAGLHLTFPTKSFMSSTEETLYDGFFQVASGRRMYATKRTTNSFMHGILVDTSRMDQINGNLDRLAKIWHYNLWPLQRYLKAVGSDLVSMDNLLDLIYSLEGLFENNTSSDFIKLTCISFIAENRKEAISFKGLLNLAFRMRNEIAHGAKSYTSTEYVMLGNKKILAQEVYWDMKWLVACMILYGIQKLLDNPSLKNLRFTEDDLIGFMFAQ